MPTLLTLLASLPSLLGSTGPASDTLSFVVQIQGNEAGQESVIREEGGRTRIVFEFNDRGRGPRLETAVRVDRRGLPLTLEVTGHDYLKDPVTERFEVQGGRASWSTGPERGSGAAGGFYVPLQGSPELSVLLVRALRATPARRLALLPAGEARLEEVRTERVARNGETLTVTLAAVSGLGFTPDYLWLDPAGDLFLAGGGWQRTVRRGWEAAADRLIAIQDSLAGRRWGDVAQRLSDRPRGPVAFTHVAVFDAPGARLLPDQTVVVDGNRIRAVGPAAATPVPAGARRIDGRGRTLLPGLWDMHAHLSDVDGLLDLSNGITSVRDLANDVDYLLATRRAYDAGTAIGPRVAMAGFMDGPGPFAGPTKALVSTREEALGWVDRYHSLGYEQIKLYSSLDPALVAPIAERAHALGMRVSGHIPRGMLAREAVRAGYDEIQHTNMLFLNFLGDTLDTRTPLRFTAVGRFGADLDLEADSVRAFLDELKARGTVIDPTVAAFEGMFGNDPGQLSAGDAEIAGRLPAVVQRGLAGGGLPADGPTRARYRASYARMLAMVKALHQAGIPLVAGTDCLAGFCLHRELELYVQAGIPSAEVLRIATWEPARILKRTDHLGSIEPGKLADLALVEGDPVADIGTIRQMALVMKDGVLFDPAALQAELGIRDWKSVHPKP